MHCKKATSESVKVWCGQRWRRTYEVRVGIITTPHAVWFISLLSSTEFCVVFTVCALRNDSGSYTITVGPVQSLWAFPDYSGTCRKTEGRPQSQGVLPCTLTVGSAYDSGPCMTPVGHPQLLWSLHDHIVLCMIITVGIAWPQLAFHHYSGPGMITADRARS